MNPLQRQFNTLLNEKAWHQKPQPSYVIEWQDGSTTRVFRRGNVWNWGGNESSHLEGIRDQLAYDEANGRRIGRLVKMKGQ